MCVHIVSKAVLDKTAMAFVSEILVPGGCQCAKRARNEVLVPIVGSSGMCNKRKATGSSYVCDFMGDYWCETVDAIGYTPDGPCTDDGCPCRPFQATNSYVLRPFRPISQF